MSSAGEAIMLQGLPPSGKYHEEATPVMAPLAQSTPSPAAPLCSKTPQKLMGYLYNNEQYRTPNTRTILRTPSSIKTPSSIRTPSSSLGTPSTGRSSASRKTAPRVQIQPSPHGVYNPFENFSVDHLHGPVFSPSVFAKNSASSCEKTPSSFHWSIEHLAVLHPADIDEMPVHQEAVQRLDVDMEERAQRAIDNYFSTHMIVPSPWGDSSKRKPFHLPQTPKTPMSPLWTSQTPSSEASQKPPLPKPVTKDAEVQTMLSLPMDFDLQGLLNQQHYSEIVRPSSSGETSPETVGNSSLRRKLFFQGDSGTPISPVKPGQMRSSLPMDFDTSPKVSPIKCVTTPIPRKSSSAHTPGSNHFSSSPIALSSSGSYHQTTPSLRRCSTAPDLMASPELSPIRSAKIQQRTGSDGSTPLCQPLQATPSTGRRHTPMGLASPGMSPIHLSCVSYSHISQSSGTNQKQIDSPGISPVFITSELGAQGQVSQLDYEHVQRDIPFIGDETMETEDAEGLQEECGINKKALPSEHRVVFDIASDAAIDSDLIYNQDYVSQSQGFNSQDTGYQTNSLQLTHFGDTGLHTNLTNQFQNMPLSSTCIDEEDGGEKVQSNQIMTIPQEDGSWLHSIVNSHQMAPPFQCTISQMNTDSDIKSGNSSGSGISALASTDSDYVSYQGSQLEEESVLRRAREVLARLDRYCPNQQSEGQTKSVPTDGDPLDSKQDDVDDSTSVLNPRMVGNVGVPLFPWKPVVISVATPQRQKFQKLGVLSDAPSAKLVRPSEVASKVLQRAGQDYIRYCKEVPSSDNQENFMELSSGCKPNSALR